MSPHFGPCKRPCLWFCLASSSAHSLWPASPPQTPGFIGASPTRREGANLTSDIPSGIYFSAYGAHPPFGGSLSEHQEVRMEALETRDPGAPPQPPRCSRHEHGTAASAA